MAAAAPVSHGCVMYNIAYPPLEMEPQLGLPRYPPEVSPKPFSLSDPGAIGALVLATAPPDPPNPEMAEPGDGLVAEWVDQDRITRCATAARCLTDYVPRVFRRKPLRRLEAIPAEERLERFDIMLAGSFVATSITFVRLEFEPSSSPTSETEKKVRHALHNCTSLEVLIVRHAGLSQLGWIRSSRLRVLDLAGNAVKSVSQCEEVAERSPCIEQLNLLDNPVSDRPEFFSRIIGMLPDLEVLNEKAIAPAMRVGCVAALGKVAGGVGLYRWDLCLASVPQVREMTAPNASWGFRPETITKLVLSEQDLTEFHVGQLPKLQFLDLSKNKITELRGAGLERCSLLASLNLSSNLLHSRDSLDPLLGCLSGLKRLWLSGNKLDSSSYPNWAIYACRNLRGTNHHLGLVELDGSPVTLDATMHAIKSCGGDDESSSASSLRWKLALIQVFGHAQLRNYSFMQSLRVARLSNLGLCTVDLNIFSSRLEVLDLSGNNLGPSLDDKLAKLTGLRVLDVSENPKLKLKPIMEVIAKGAHPNLFSVCFAVDKTPEHKRHTIRQSYRKKVLAQLLPCCPLLEMLDGRYISVTERVDLLIAAKLPTPEIEKFRFNLAVLMSLNKLPQLARVSFAPADVEALIASSQEVCTAQSLKRFTRGSGLLSDYCNLARFEMLEEVDLSANQITDPRVMGLQLLKNLRALDLSDNKISLPHKEIAEFIDTLSPTLVAITLVNNPCMAAGPADRSLVLRSLKSLLQPQHSALRVINTEITIDERMAVACVSGGVDEDGLELSIRFTHCLAFRAPTERKFWPSVQMLDFRNCNLRVLDVAGFPSLRVLLLRNNRIRTVSAIQGLVDLRVLHTLDLRDNELTEVDQVSSIISALPNLQTVGLSGNKFSTSTSQPPYREKVIRAISPLWKNLRYPFGCIDGEEISVQEICSAAAAVDAKAVSTPSKQLFRFRVALMRKCPPQAFESISELKLENCGLANISFFDFGRITRLSLAFNDLKSSAIGIGGIEQLKDLRALDLSYNLIKNRKPIKKILSKLEFLEAFWISPNPGFPVDSLTMRRKLVSYRVKCKPQMPPLRLLDGKPVSDLDPRPLVPVYVQKAHKK